MQFGEQILPFFLLLLLKFLEIIFLQIYKYNTAFFMRKHIILIKTVRLGVK